MSIPLIHSRPITHAHVLYIVCANTRRSKTFRAVLRTKTTSSPSVCMDHFILQAVYEFEKELSKLDTFILI